MADYDENGQPIDDGQMGGALALLQQGGQPQPENPAGSLAAKMDPMEVIRRVMAARQAETQKPVDTSLSPEERNQMIMNMGLRLMAARGDNRGAIGTIADAGIGTVNDIAGIKAGKQKQAADAVKSRQADSTAMLNYLAKVYQKDKPFAVPEGSAVPDGKGGWIVPSPKKPKLDNITGPDGIPRYNMPGDPRHGTPVLPGVEKPLSPEQDQQNQKVLFAQKFLEDYGVFKNGKIDEKHPALAPYEIGPDGNPLLDDLGQPVKNKNPMHSLVMKYVEMANTPRLNQQGKSKADERLFPKFKPQATGFDLAQDSDSGAVILYKDGKQAGSYKTPQEARAAMAKMQAQPAVEQPKGALAQVDDAPAKPAAPGGGETKTAKKAPTRRTIHEDPKDEMRAWMAANAESERISRERRAKRDAKEQAANSSADDERKAAAELRKKRMRESEKMAEVISQMNRR